MIESNKIIWGDCTLELKDLPDESVDAIITDPPYGLEFMGKSWDGTGIANNIDMWKECLRVLKSGGYLLSFGGTRTYHRMACAIEDAGFEIRDMIEWVYGSGFPKSLNIGKQIDKLQGNEREEIGDSWNMPDLRDVGAKSKEACGIDKLSFGQVQDAKRKIEKITKGSSEFEGWGTALKPAHEPIVVARKPLSEKTVAQQVLKNGCGGINIDESRIGFVNEADYKESTDKNQHEDFGTKPMTNNNVYGDYSMIQPKNYQPTGRFPANLIHDGSDEVLKEFEKAGISGNGNFSKGSVRKTLSEDNGFKLGFLKGNSVGNSPDNYGDIGTPARFFKSCPFELEDYAPFYYTAKASKSERNFGCEELEDKKGGSMEANITEKMQLGGASLKGEPKEIQSTKNSHPTVKPIKLMEYLIKLVSREGAVILDPFLGSGTTAVACLKTNRKFIGIEKEDEYIKIAEARIKPYLELKKLGEENQK